MLSVTLSNPGLYFSALLYQLNDIENLLSLQKTGQHSIVILVIFSGWPHVCPISDTRDSMVAVETMKVIATPVAFDGKVAYAPKDIGVLIHSEAMNNVLKLDLKML